MNFNCKQRKINLKLKMKMKINCNLYQIFVYLYPISIYLVLNSANRIKRRFPFQEGYSALGAGQHIAEPAQFFTGPSMARPSASPMQYWWHWKVESGKWKVEMKPCFRKQIFRTFFRNKNKTDTICFRFWINLFLGGNSFWK